MIDTDKPGSPEELLHYGIKGMKWGVRKSSGGVSRKTNREARKDAEEFTRAKMFYGEGAGTRRKLIKNTVEAKAKRDPSYKKAFEEHVNSTDMSKRASQARSQRKRKNAVNATRKTARGVSHTLRGNARYASTAAAMLAGGYMYAQKTGIDKVIQKQAKTAYRNIRNGKYGSANDFLRQAGII